MLSSVLKQSTKQPPNHHHPRRTLVIGAPVAAMASCCSGARDCIFCGLVKQAGSPGSRVLYQDASVVVLPDIRPAAAVHLLVIPRAHIPNVNSLGPTDVALVRHMAAVGEQVLQQQDQQLQLPRPRQHKFGFHKLPFRSVDHLHLHCFTLPHKWYRWVQYQSDLNWVTDELIIDQLTRMPSSPSPPAAAGGAAGAGVIAGAGPDSQQQ